MNSSELNPLQEEHVEEQVSQVEESVDEQIGQVEEQVEERNSFNAVDTIRPPSTNANPRQPSPSLPEIPATDLDLSLSLDSIIGPSNPEVAKVQKRASNVMKLAQENEKLKAELKAMSDRLEAAERKRVELARKGQDKGEYMS